MILRKRMVQIKSNIQRSLIIIEECRFQTLPIEKKIFASARDVGNIAAGFVAAVNGVIWPLSRTCFDGLESIQKNRNVSEGISTQFAEALGYTIGIYVYTQKRVSIPGLGINRSMKRPEVMITF